MDNTAGVEASLGTISPDKAPKKRVRVPTPVNRAWVRTIIHQNGLHVKNDYLAALESLVAKRVYDGIEKLKTEGKRITLGVEDLM